MTKQEHAIELIGQLNERNLDQAIGILTDLVNGKHLHVESEPFTPSLTNYEFMKRVNELRESLSKHSFEDIDTAMATALDEKYGKMN